MWLCSHLTIMQTSEKRFRQLLTLGDQTLPPCKYPKEPWKIHCLLLQGHILCPVLAL
ncbi:hypothetical protein B296_00042047 [Ensete ventricosum]|uniref:Uncharacterized protein n=1 Tax=Ensete ventricosum TaxID=4639 RepID=A0A426YDX9_ENSVE|nr:hypothetical protein B296_00042047 [Ensete ventricosum]